MAGAPCVDRHRADTGVTTRIQVAGAFSLIPPVEGRLNRIAIRFPGHGLFNPDRCGTPFLPIKSATGCRAKIEAILTWQTCRSSLAAQRSPQAR